MRGFLQAKAGVALFAALLFAAGCAKMDEQEETPSFVPARILSVYLPLMEKPDATRCLIAGSRAEAYREFFDRAGIAVDDLDAGDGKYDIVFLAGSTKTALAELADFMGEKGVFARVVDIRGKTSALVKTELEELSAQFPRAHLWMPALEDWLVIGRKSPAKLKLDSMMEVFSREGGFDDLDAAQCQSLPEMFASYAGELEEAMPAFESLDAEAELRAQHLVTKDIPSIDWISADDDIDADILERTSQEIRSMQVVRRVVLEGDILADAQDIDAATEAWARAAMRNPRDPMLVDRLERLWKNADAFFRVGNFSLAAKCYETYLMIRPDDWQSAEALSFCLAQLGKRELSAQIHEKAMLMRDGK